MRNISKWPIVLLLGAMTLAGQARQPTSNTTLATYVGGGEGGSHIGTWTFQVNGKITEFWYANGTTHLDQSILNDRRAWQRGAEWRIIYKYTAEFSDGGAPVPLVETASFTGRIIEATSSNGDSRSADNDWDAFWRELRAAVKTRDQNALMKLMPSDFAYNCCDSYDENKNGDTRDEAFRLWAEPKIRGWAILNNVLTQGAVIDKPLRVAGQLPNSGRVAPPTARSRNYRGWIAKFEIRNGRWYFVSFAAAERDG